MAENEETGVRDVSGSYAWLPGMVSTPAPDEKDTINAYMGFAGTISPMVTEGIHVIDFIERRFAFIAAHAFFLCGHSVEYALERGFDFYPEVVYPDDWPLVAKMYRAAYEYTLTSGFSLDEADYFSCTFRVMFPAGQRQFQPMMAYYRIKPLPVGGRIRYAVCSMGSSATEKPEQLRLYYQNGMEYEMYNISNRQWKHVKIETLSDRERAILILSQQGKSGKEVADMLCISPKTVQNSETSIYRKLGVHNMKAAILYATNHRMIFLNGKYRTEVWQPEHVPERDGGRTRRLLTPSMLMSIQQGLDNGQSIRSLAKREGIAESAIRYAVKQERLIKPVM